MKIIQKNFLLALLSQTLFAVLTCIAAPWNLPQQLTDQNMSIKFEVHAPWNILDGIANEVSGKISLLNNKDPGSLLADISVEKLKYKAGVSVAGRLVSVWLKSNPPTPAKFVIGKSSLACTPETISKESPCKGTVYGKLTIWEKDYNIDVPIEMKPVDAGYLLEGVKEIKFGEYGFGDPESTIASLKPVIDLNFSIQVPSEVRAIPKEAPIYDE